MANFAASVLNRREVQLLAARTQARAEQLQIGGPAVVISRRTHEEGVGLFR